MAENIYIGQSGISKEVSVCYVGIDGKSKEITKGYIGINGKSKLFYESAEFIPFTSSPAPTSWTKVTLGIEYTAENTYGTWRIWADNYLSSGFSDRYAYYAFDNSTSTYWSSDDHSSTSDVYCIGIDMPTNITINPTNIYIYSRYEGNSSYSATVQGYNSSTDSWEDLGTITRHSSATATNITVSNSNYYSRFRLQLYQYSSSYDNNMIYEFKITSGTIKKVS